MFSISVGRMLAAGVILGFLGLGLFPILKESPVADIKIEAVNKTPIVDQLLTMDLYLTAEEPVNAFKGILTFDPSKLYIDSIDYNVSVADLWAKLPWYSNGDGTMTFIGGTTRKGGFTGKEKIISVTFKTKEAGETVVKMGEVRILRHDGLGTDAPVPLPIDTIFTISPEELDSKTVSDTKSVKEEDLYVLHQNVSTDLNNDGKVSIADSSIFMTHLATQNLRSDFNQDGKVDLKDLSILNK